MRLARARTHNGVVSGEYDGSTLITDDHVYEISDEELLAPTQPSAIYCVGRNYATTLDQMDYDRPAEPDFFIKPPASILGPYDVIEYPTFSEEVTYAGELAAVIGKQCHDVSEAEVDNVVRGYTIMNDVDALDQPGRTARKAFDGSGPLGPWIETDIDPTSIEMRTEINGEERQSATTNRMLFSPREIVSFLSKRFTLRSGDVIAFGSPENPGEIRPGDEINITYEGVGTLRNTVVEKDTQ